LPDKLIEVILIWLRWFFSCSLKTAENCGAQVSQTPRQRWKTRASQGVVNGQIVPVPEKKMKQENK
jgi:hypothetical protein